MSFIYAQQTTNDSTASSVYSEAFDVTVLSSCSVFCMVPLLKAFSGACASADVNE